MNGYQLVINSAIEKLQSGQTVDEMVDNVIKSANEEFNNEVNFNFLYDTFNKFKMLSRDTYNHSDSDELEEAFLNTLKDFEIDISNDVLIQELRQLSKSDKLIKVEGNAYCVKINLLLSKISEYKSAIEKHKMLNALSPLYGGIATYPNNDISECIQPRINALDEAIYLTNNSISVIVSKNILGEFKDDAYSMDFAYSALENIGKENINFNIINEEKFDILIDNRKFLNASSPLKREDFF